MRRFLKTAVLALILVPASAAAQVADIDPWAGYEPRNIRTLHDEAEARKARLRELAKADLAQRMDREPQTSPDVYAHPLRAVPDAEPEAVTSEPVISISNVDEGSTLIRVSPRPQPRPLPSWKGKGPGLAEGFEARENLGEFKTLGSANLIG